MQIFDLTSSFFVIAVIQLGASILVTPFLIRFFLLTGFKDYLFLLMASLLWPIHAFAAWNNLTSATHFTTFLSRSTWFFAEIMFFLILISFMTSNSFKNVKKFIFVIIIIDGIVLFFSVVNPQFSSDFNFYIWFLLDVLRLGVGLLMIFTFFNLEVIHDSSRANLAKFYFLAVGTTHVIAGVGELLVLPFLLLGLVQFPALIPILELTAYLCLPIMIFFISAILIFPESILLTKTQLLQATKLYQISGSKTILPRESSIIDYVKNIPPNIMDSLKI